MNRYVFICLWGCAVLAVSNVSVASSTELDCWRISDETGRDFRVEENQFKGWYAGRLTIDTEKSKIVWAKPARSIDGPKGKLFDSGWFNIIDNKPNPVENWISAVDLNNQTFLVLNRKTGAMVSTGLPWQSTNDGPYDYQIDGTKAECALRKDLF